MKGCLDLSPAEARTVLADVLEALKNPAQVAALEQALVDSEGDMLRRMQLAFPVAVRIEAGVLARHGLVGNAEGPATSGEAVVQFHQLVQAMQDQDPELERLYSQLKMHLIPSSR